jgi:hypothetical protein
MFPDIANVLHIREALWRHKILGNASIMVGAGFSRNAEPLSSTARPMPNWSQMATALCHPLYPMDDAQQKHALNEASGTSGFLRLAQEYQSAFGVSSLNDQIRNLVPDLDYRPGDPHKRLLRLPWADVFSTNWDTLLERACTDVFDRSYDIVRTIREIPFTMRPRIVKLHGSFPGHEPFIFTEEEYRTYPGQFSAFVNLVQQSMMETIFCLLGFSGDDPNFLHWSGWVRDNLSNSAPRIYLVGWLELSNHRRRMLEARNVMPVDLSALPQATTWPQHLRHRYATEWFIATLEQGKPYSASAWPRRATAPPATPSHLGDIPLSTAPLTQNEPYPAFGKPDADRQAAFKAVIEVWAHNRRLYPGWLVAPENNRKTLQQSLSNWLSEFAFLSEFSIFDQLKSLSELAWLINRSLLKLPSHLEDVAFAAIAAVDRLARTVDGKDTPKSESWDEISRGSDTLALILARNARHAGNRERFDRALSHLKPNLMHDSECRNAIIYEECLWDLASGDLSSLLARLDAWLPAQGETLWSFRKAGLLAEMGEDTRACGLVETTLMQIRRTRRRDVDDIPSLSLESWALFLALPYSPRGVILRPTATLPKDMPEPFERWHALGIVDCNAFDEYQMLKRALERETPQYSEFTKRRGFDLDHVHTTQHLGRGPMPTVIAAYEMVILAEITGLPPLASRTILFEEGLRAAAKILASEDALLAGQLLLRLEPKDDLLDDVVSRTWVARLPNDAVEMIRNAATKRVAAGLAKLGASANRNPDGIASLRTALEVLSRIAVRLSPKDLLALFEEAAKHYRSARFRQLAPEIGRALANLMGRALQSLPRAEVVDILPQLFALPLPRKVGPTIHESYWQDAVTLLPDWIDDAVDEAIGRKPHWKDIVSHLLVAASGPDAIDRTAAIGRLFRLHQWKILEQNEIEAFARAIWNASERDRVGLPSNTGLRTWVLLLLPEEHVGQARDALLNAVDSHARDDKEKASIRLAEIGEILQNLKRQDTPFELLETLKANLAQLVGAWATHHTPKQGRPDPFLFNQDRGEEAVAGVAAILPYIDMTDALLQILWSKVDDMDDASGAQPFSGFPLYPLLAGYSPNKTTELIERLRRTLLSDKEDQVSMAVNSLVSWIVAYESFSEDVKSGLRSLVREVGIGIAARRDAILRSALSLAGWIFRKGPNELKTLIAADCDHGLTALVEEATYSRTGTTMDIPSIRARCFRLAVAMANAGFSEPRGVIAWLANAKDDPLPEVRNANHIKDE